VIPDRPGSPDELRTWLAARATTGEFSGVVLVRRAGETLFEAAHGLASRAHGVPNAMDTRFAVASVGKWPLAVATLRLVERGELDLGARVVDLLPAAQRPASLGGAHTLHHLLSMTSGLPNWYDDSDEETWDAFEAAVAAMPGRGRRPADLVPLFADAPARRPPGEVYEYCDANFVLVGLVLEAVTGRDWADVLRDEVLDVVEMPDTGIDSLDEDPPRMAVGYLVDDGPAERRRSNVFSVTARPMPDGGLVTTAADVAAFVEALQGGRLLGPDLLAAMRTPHAPPTDEGEAYGYGCLLTVEDDRVVIIGHAGGDPGVACLVAHHLEAATTVIVLCNQDRGAWPAALATAAALGLRDPRT
jgi:CubicO group peptidase (beta-lactamase class C family)